MRKLPHIVYAFLKPIASYRLDKRPMGLIAVTAAVLLESDLNDPSRGISIFVRPARNCVYLQGCFRI